ncbi:uncharacterized protein LOC128345377 isoform X2 [Hemicordylus capensis]|uniref:uncharacterized protein LOC128345377 isoform X2 n=1 Tax=Hemicordylus capensis TaxID=884348 RepID=UPI002302BC5B|nr:uncharacterized protein LOC128345377 isoform X2 [Hemicordylus capensis]
MPLGRLSTSPLPCLGEARRATGAAASMGDAVVPLALRTSKRRRADVAERIQKVLESPGPFFDLKSDGSSSPSSPEFPNRKCNRIPSSQTSEYCVMQPLSHSSSNVRSCCRRVSENGTSEEEEIEAVPRSRTRWLRVRGWTIMSVHPAVPAHQFKRNLFNTLRLLLFLLIHPST